MKLKTVILVVWFSRVDAAFSLGLKRKEAKTTAFSIRSCGIFNS